MSILRFKLLLTWLLSLALVLGTIQILFWLLPVDSYYSKQRYFELQADKIEALALGVSHTRAINFPSLGIPGFSYHDPGSDLQTVAEKYRAIAPLTPNLKYILLAINPGYLHFIQSDKKRAQKEVFVHANYPKYSNFNGPLYWNLLFHYPKRMLWKLRKNFRKKITLLIPHLEVSNRHLPCQLKKSRKIDHEDGFIGGYFDEYADGKCLNELAIATVNIHAGLILNTRIQQENFKTNKQTMTAMTAMIQGLATNQHKLILFIPPFTAEYYDHRLWEETKLEQQNYLQELALEPNVLFVDYHDLFYQRNYVELNTLFYDDNHLGLNGAREFSKILGEAIKEFDTL